MSPEETPARSVSPEKTPARSMSPEKNPARSSRPLRLRRARYAEMLGLRVPVAEGSAARLLGLALLDRSRAGPGLLIPHCSCVHTFGMRFALDIVFLDGEERPIERRRALPARRVVACRGAQAVLEVPHPTDLLGFVGGSGG